MSAFGDRRLLARAGIALMLANARFWPTVAPLTARQLNRWEQRAHTIRDPALQSLALEKLSQERFNAQVAATLATLAPREHRQAVIEAIVAYEVIYDYLDGLTEQPTTDALQHGHELYQAFTDAITPHTTPTGGYYASRPTHDDGYLGELVHVVRTALGTLPSTPVVTDAALRAARRCAQAQIRAHAEPILGAGQLEAWACEEAEPAGLGWREFLAGAASSVLAIHALIAAAANRHTGPGDARELDETYLSICALSTILDSLIDHQHDTQTGRDGYLRYYQSHGQLAHDLSTAAHRAIQRASRLPNRAHHVMTLVGVVAYYISAPTATTDFARPVVQHVRRELEPLITPTLAVMHTWRAAKHARGTLPRNSPRLQAHRAHRRRDPTQASR